MRRIFLFFMRNMYIKFQNPGIHLSSVVTHTKQYNEHTNEPTKSNMPLQFFQSRAHNVVATWFVCNSHEVFFTGRRLFHLCRSTCHLERNIFQIKTQKRKGSSYSKSFTARMLATVTGNIFNGVTQSFLGKIS